MTRFKSSTFVKYLATAVALIGSIPFAGAADGTTVGGFLDAGFAISGPKGVDPTIIRDGALYFNHAAGNSSFKFDMPFQAGGTDNNDLLVGFDKAQVYLSHTYASGAAWRMGQFDSIFGLERNDTIDNFFVDQGVIYALTQPKTNTGVEASYKISDMLKAQAYVSGARDSGGEDLGTRPEFGAKVSMSGEYNVSLGGWYKKVAADTNAMYLNLAADTKLAGLNLGAEAVYQKAGDTDAKMSFGVMGDTNVMENMDAGIRAQYLMDQVADGSSQLQATAGVRYKMDKNLSVKANYVFDTTTAATGATSVTDHSGQLAAVFGF